MYPAKQQALSTGSYLQDSAGQLIYSFVDNEVATRPGNTQLSGNPCLLFAGRLGDKTLATTRRAHTYCLSSIPDQHSIENPTIALQCYAPDGSPISCCGHGLLAAAHYWTQTLETGQLSFTMGGSVINSISRNSCLWLQFGPIDIQRCELPVWIDVFVSRLMPIAAATAGDDNGYLILQWPDATDLAQLDIAVERIAAATQRAVICSAAQPLANKKINAAASNENMHDIQLRYFAPQYGVAEDIATGSAMRILAAYWATRFKSIRATQVSAQGGILYSRYSPSGIEVGGYCLPANLSMENGDD